MRRVAWWFAVIAPVLCPAADELTIATYNIENYVATDRMTGLGYRKDYPKPEAAKTALRAVLKQLDADILVLQEMGPSAYLTELQRDLERQGTPYPYAVLMRGADEDRHSAVLSRRPFARVAPHAGLVFKYRDGHEAVKRGLLEVVVDTSSGPVTLWALHLKSRYTDEAADPASTERRAGEAMAVREFILQQTGEAGDARFVILGDFNDSKVSASLRYLTRKGKRQFAELLPATDENGEHWTHYYRREDEYSRVDHILVSPALLPAVKDRQARIFDGAEVRAASDHRPVVVRLTFGAAEAEGSSRE